MAEPLLAAAYCIHLADWLFAAPAVIVQPATGFWMAHLTGIPVGTPLRYKTGHAKTRRFCA